MRRFTTILLFLALSACVACSIVTKDVPMKDAEQANSVAEPDVAPVASVDEVPKPNSGTENAKCAKVGEFCINHKDCCSNGCLGYMHRCVSAREAGEGDE